MEQALNPDKFELADIVEPHRRLAAKMFKCRKCSCIPLNPVQAPPSSECSHIFCESCTDEQQPLPLDNFMSKWYADLPVRCPYSSAHSKSVNSEGLGSSFGDTETCADEQETTDEEQGARGEEKHVRHMTPAAFVQEVQCGWKGTMQGMRRHLLECPFQLIKCPSGVVFRRKDIENHRQTECPCTFETCPICDERVKVGTMEQHLKKAGEHAPLLEEKVEEPRSSVHGNRSRGLAAIVLFCLVLFLSGAWLFEELETEIKVSEKRISKLEGTVKDREADIKASEKRISMLEESQPSTYEWVIKNPVEVEANHPKTGDYFYSPEFFLRGLGPWKLRICPFGYLSIIPGVDAALWGSDSTASAKVHWRLTVSNGKWGEHDEDDFDGTRGLDSVGVTYVAWPATNDEPVRIKVEFLKVTYVE